MMAKDTHFKDSHAKELADDLKTKTGILDTEDVEHLQFLGSDLNNLKKETDVEETIDVTDTQLSPSGAGNLETYTDVNDTVVEVEMQNDEETEVTDVQGSK